MNLSIINSLLRDWGTDPLFLIACAGLPVAWFALRRVRGLASWLFVGLWLMVLLGASAPKVVNPMVDAWETQHPLDESCGPDAPIVLLGAGVDRKATSAEQTEYLYPPSHVRTARVARMAAIDLQAPIIVAGAGLHEVSEADMMRAYLLQRGVLDTRIVSDKESRNTRENAINVAAIVLEKGWGRQVRLVTSALHMPRAMGVFSASDLLPCAIPVDFLAVKNVPWYAMAPQTTALAKFRTYLHERIGTVVYRSKGWL